MVPKTGATNTGFENVSGVLREVKLTSASAGIDGITIPTGETYIGSEVDINAKTTLGISAGRLEFLSDILFCNTFTAAYNTTKYSASFGKLSIAESELASMLGLEIT